MSLTLSLHARSSLIEVDYFPPIDLNNRNYELALLNFETFNSIPNIDETNNKFYYNETDVIEIPKGSYEIENIEEYIRLKLKEKHKYDESAFYLHANKLTLKCELYSVFDVDFTKENNIGTLLGFKNIRLERKKKHKSEFIINIFKVNSIQITCNITSGSFNNNKQVHTIYEFFPNVATGFKISERPNHIIYYPITVGKINNLTIKICDQHENLVDFQSEAISIRLHLRPMKSYK